MRVGHMREAQLIMFFVFCTTEPVRPWVLSGPDLQHDHGGQWCTACSPPGAPRAPGALSALGGAFQALQGGQEAQQGAQALQEGQEAPQAKQVR